MSLLGLLCLVSWLQGEKPSVAATLDESNLTPIQEKEKKWFLDRRAVEIIKSAAGTTLYVLRRFEYDSRFRQEVWAEEITSTRPDWVNEEGKVILTASQKEHLAGLAITKPPKWVFWSQDPKTLYKIWGGLFALQFTAVVWGIAGMCIGAAFSSTHAHPAWWWPISGGSLVASLAILLAAGFAPFELGAWVIASGAMLCFAIPGGFLCATLRSLKKDPKHICQIHKLEAAT
jgi:hypothetical protein